MAPGVGAAVAGVLVHRVELQIAAVVARPHFDEPGLVARERGVATVPGDLQNQVAIEHVECARGVANRLGVQAVTGAGRGPGIAAAEVAGERIVGKGPGPGREGAYANAAVVFVAQRNVSFVPDARNVDLAVAPALADEALQLEATWQVEFRAEVGLSERDVCVSGAVLAPLHQRVGPRALSVFGREQLAGRIGCADRTQGVGTTAAADLAGAADFSFCKASQTEGSEVDGATRTADDQARNEQTPAAQDAHPAPRGGRSATRVGQAATNEVVHGE